MINPFTKNKLPQNVMDLINQYRDSLSITGNIKLISGETIPITIPKTIRLGDLAIDVIRLLSSINLRHNKFTMTNIIDVNMIITLMSGKGINSIYLYDLDTRLDKLDPYMPLVITIVKIPQRSDLYKDKLLVRNSSSNLGYDPTIIDNIRARLYQYAINHNIEWLRHLIPIQNRNVTPFIFDEPNQQDFDILQTVISRFGPNEYFNLAGLYMVRPKCSYIS